MNTNIPELVKHELILNFWDNLDLYKKEDQVIEAINNTFPEFFFENYERYDILFSNISESYSNYYKEYTNEIIDFSINTGDTLRYIVEELKNTYIQHNNIYTEDVEDIIQNIYINKYTETQKNKKVSLIIENLIKKF